MNDIAILSPNESWLGKYYFIEADDIANSQASELDLLEHAKLKWTGALPENLERHCLTEPPLPFDAISCSLCRRHIVCRNCSIKNITGNTCTSTYVMALGENKPQLMIDLLDIVIEKVKEGTNV